jgi:hypothetical protein
MQIQIQSAVSLQTLPELLHQNMFGALRGFHNRDGLSQNDRYCQKNPRGKNGKYSCNFEADHEGLF